MSDDKRDFDQEFTQILADEGITVDGGAAVAGPESEPGPEPEPDAQEPDEREEEDFLPPDPDLPEVPDRLLWAWVALGGGLVLALAGASTSWVPGFVGVLGAIAALGGLIALFSHIPRHRDEHDDGAEV